MNSRNGDISFDHFIQRVCSPDFLKLKTVMKKYCYWNLYQDFAIGMTTKRNIVIKISSILPESNFEELNLMHCFIIWLYFYSFNNQEEFSCDIFKDL